MTQQKMADDELVADLKQGLTTKDISRKYDVNERTVRRRKLALAAKGWSPEHDMTKECPDGYLVKGTSTLYDADGKVKSQWVKTHAEKESVYIESCKEAFIEFAQNLEQIKPMIDKPLMRSNMDLMSVYPLGDPHVGMLAWGEETGGDNWDLTVAEKILSEAYERVIMASPSSEKAVIINLGDFFHYDNQEGMTSRSKNILDRDGRYAKMVGVGLRIIRRMIYTALQHHTYVDVINVVGNHDETGALFLSLCLAHIYEKEPRVRIDTSPSLFHYIKFGKVLIGAHHGHTCKMDRLTHVMAADRYEDWGQTKYRYWLTGHIHSDNKKEYPGCMVESFRTMAAPDAYAAGGGWRSGRDTKSLIYHKEYGEVERHIISLDLVKDQFKKGG